LPSIVASTLRWQENQVVSNGELLLALLVDVASLTAQLYLSGGATNPFVFLYLQGDLAPCCWNAGPPG
jgi:two-component system sensor histidine kinase RegB